jgi:hypothetical protein
LATFHSLTYLLNTYIEYISTVDKNIQIRNFCHIESPADLYSSPEEHVAIGT